MGYFQLAVIIRVEHCKSKLLQMKMVISPKSLRIIMTRRYLRLLSTEMRKWKHIMCMMLAINSVMFYHPKQLISWECRLIYRFLKSWLIIMSMIVKGV
ncbi:Uncharacterised protein [Bacteroides thetaiotaomicron]|uniref:Uncharacterized protein n=1 Tax=Bacteroides thetaiotaomicron TaxID=818 RepID=A0A174LF16_BACT4|nr:Uncharacterised protein [Bacteroides thetaiotaomicron]